jgi:hypothetical protein
MIDRHRDGADQRDDDLYVGYLPAAPPRVARFVRRVAPSLVVGTAGIAAILAALQGPFDPGTFEFGTTHRFEGTVLERPYPILVDSEPRGALLVREGKHGAAPDATGLDGRRVQLEATRIESPLGRILELVPASLEPVDSAAAGARGSETTGAADLLGRIEVTGEIVDSKCVTGVMKPGKGKPHRSCAARCLSGGIPPQLLVVSAEGASRLLVLADSTGGPLAPEAFLDRVGEPVTANGTVERRAGLLVLRVDDGGLRARVDRETQGPSLPRRVP